MRARLLQYAVTQKGTIDLNPEAVAAISAPRRRANCVTFGAGDPPSERCYELHRVRQLAVEGAVPSRFHDLRHRSGVDYLKAGDSI